MPPNMEQSEGRIKALSLKDESEVKSQGRKLKQIWIAKLKQFKVLHLSGMEFWWIVKNIEPEADLI